MFYKENAIDLTFEIWPAGNALERFFAEIQFICGIINELPDNEFLERVW